MLTLSLSFTEQLKFLKRNYVLYKKMDKTGDHHAKPNKVDLIYIYITCLYTYVEYRFQKEKVERRLPGKRKGRGSRRGGQKRRDKNMITIRIHIDENITGSPLI